MWAPLGVANETANWHPESRERGSWAVIASCLTTIGLCIWTAVHLNIPEHGKKHTHVWRKAGWALMGLFAPEIVCLIAFEQWREHVQLNKEMEKHLAPLGPPHVERKRRWWRWWQRAGPEERAERAFTKLPDGDDDGETTVRGMMSKKPAADVHHLAGPSSPQQQQEVEYLTLTTAAATPRHRLFRWTPTHSFYAAMGGFAFDNTRDPQSCPLPRSRARLTLSPRALVFLAEHEPDLVPDVSEMSIRDKSKADSVAKFVAFWQALWFLATFATRLAQGFGVCLLEVNTALHVVCALVGYLFFWLKKPVDVMEPTTIPASGERAAGICAAMSVVSAEGEPPFRLKKGWDGRERGVEEDEEEEGEEGGSSSNLKGGPIEIDPRVLAMAALLESPGLRAGEANLEHITRPDRRVAASLDQQQQGKKGTPGSEALSITPPQCIVRAPLGERDTVRWYWHQGLTAPLTLVCDTFSDFYRTVEKELHPVFTTRWLWADLKAEAGMENGVEGGRATTTDPLQGSTATTTRREKSTSVVSGQDIARYSIALEGFRRYRALAVKSSTLSSMVAPRSADVPMYWLLGLTQLTRKFESPPSCPADTQEPETEKDGAPSSNIRSFADLKNKVFSPLFGSPLASIFGFSFSSAVYGGVHLVLGWNGPLKSDTEVILWRIAGFALSVPQGLALIFLFAQVVTAVLLAACGLLVLVVLLSTLGVRGLMSCVTRARVRSGLPASFRPVFVRLGITGGLVWVVGIGLLLSCFVGLFVFARVYIIVECFTSLPYAPSSIYQLPDWSRYVFHF